jgi:hypothetical protein
MDVASPFLLYFVACSAVLSLLFCISCVGHPQSAADEDTKTLAIDLVCSIGELNFDLPEYQFSSILDVILTKDGLVWVLDGDGSGEGGHSLLRVYDSAGVFLRTVGSNGAGPGEFRLPYALAQLRDGRVAVRDFVLADRITLYSPEGEFDDSWSIPGGLFWTFRGAYPLQVDSAGVLWLLFRRGMRPSSGQEPMFLRALADGTLLDTIAPPRLPEIDREVVELHAGSRVRKISVPFQPSGRWAWSPNGFFAVARTDEYRVEVLPVPASPRSSSQAGVDYQPPSSGLVISRSVPPVPIHSGERAAARDELASRVAAVSGGHMGSLPKIPENKPPIRSLSFSSEGRLIVWVSMPSVNIEGEWLEPRAFDLFQHNGEYSGRVILPNSFRVLGMQGDKVWGVFRDDLGVETVRIYSLFGL